MSVGMPQSLLLQEFGEHVLRAFGHVAYHVGSSMIASPNYKKDGWRDVDVRLMIPDEEYAIYGDPERPHQSRKWVSTVIAWSTFGRHLTGLPIDFQIQPISYANLKYPNPRSAIVRLCDLEA